MGNKTDAEMRKEYEQDMADLAEYEAYTNSSSQEEAQPVKKENTGSLLETLQDMATVAPQGITTWADEAQAGIQAGLKSPFTDEPFSDLYEKDVADIRENISQARERSPIATPLTELGVGVGTSFVPGLGPIGKILGAGKYSGPGQMVARGAFEGLGTADDKLSMEGATNAGLGAGIGMAGALVSGGLKKLTTANPHEIRSQVLGAGTSEFKEIGIKERQKIAKELKEMGLFSNIKSHFDTRKMKFVEKGKSLENLEKPTREKLLGRVNQATDDIQTAKMQVLGANSNNPVDKARLTLAMDDVIQEYSEEASGMVGRENTALAIRDKILEDIDNDMVSGGHKQLNVSLLERAKMRLSKDVGNYGKNPLLQSTPDEAQLYQKMYSKINQELRSSVADPRYAQFNDLQQKFLTVKTDLAKAMATESAEKVKAGYGGWMNKLMNATLGSPEAGLGMANASEMMQNPVMNAIKTPLRMGVEEAPFSTIRNFDPSIPDQQNFNREPQSVRQYPSMGSNELTPMQVTKMRLPRTTAGIIQNKDLVVAKLTVMGAGSEMIDTVLHAINEDPESLETLAPMLTMKFPTLFDKSKYNMFDGKILDPAERSKAADDVSKRDDINSIKKSKIINELNKNGKWLGE